ncbi:glyoxalase [Pedobacter yulinensis]|uniref:Glyoxalase n=1 Tax=Pedobacter yulinensis TaxID=2126353 RepID=A0A2T3HHC3_9SPHI|nr:VOC family protein [Pedobacter yulinensis]PST81845.1 glyoxalase [Pedobacter yulinensis]
MKTKPKTVINHVAQYVVDLQVSTEFYQKVIGLDTIPEPFHDGRHTWFSIGDFAHLHIISGAKNKIEHDKNSHLCFSTSDMASFITNLKSRNISFESWAGEKGGVTKRTDGIQQIYFKDPDGYWIEVNDDHR